MDSNGVLLLDMEDHFYYSMDRLGAQMWITIETSPSWIAFDDILDALETHFDAPRNQLADELRVRLQRLHALVFIETLRKTQTQLFRHHHQPHTLFLPYSLPFYTH